MAFESAHRLPADLAGQEVWTALLTAIAERQVVDDGELPHCGSLTIGPANRAAFVSVVPADPTVREFAIVASLIRKNPAIIQRSTPALPARPEHVDDVRSNMSDLQLAQLRAKLNLGGCRIATLNHAGYGPVPS